MTSEEEEGSATLFLPSLFLLPREARRKRKTPNFVAGFGATEGAHFYLQWRAETIKGSEERKEERNRRSYLTVSPGQGRHIQYLIIAPTRKDGVFLSFRRLLPNQAV